MSGAHSTLSRNQVKREGSNKNNAEPSPHASILLSTFDPYPYNNPQEIATIITIFQMGKQRLRNEKERNSITPDSRVDILEQGGYLCDQKEVSLPKWTSVSPTPYKASLAQTANVKSSTIN